MAKRQTKRQVKPEIIQDNVIDLTQVRKERSIDLKPRNLNQEIYLEALEDNRYPIVCAVGPAGCGKTMFASLFAFKQLLNNEIRKLVIARPNIALDDQDIGYLPGNVDEKMLPWVLPILDLFWEYASKKRVEYFMKEGKIEIVPLAHIRGRTFHDALIILDESQNCSTNGMMSALTRIGEGSKMVITGDLEQSDKGKNNGLSDFIARCHRDTPELIKLIQFGIRDVERSKICQEVLNLYRM